MKCEICNGKAVYAIYKTVGTKEIHLINVCKHHVWEAYHLEYHGKLRKVGVRRYE